MHIKIVKLLTEVDKTSFNKYENEVMNTIWK